MTTSDRLEDLIRDVRERIGRIENANPRDRGALAETKLRETLNDLIDLHTGFVSRHD